MRNQSLNATLAGRSVVSIMERLRKGYASPSFAADSAAMIRRRFTGTCLVANLPPICAEKNQKSMSNSVAVSQLVVRVPTNDCSRDDGVCRCQASSNDER